MTLAAFANLTVWDRIVNWYHHSVLYELVQHLSQDVFSIQFGDYEKIQLSSGVAVVVRNIIVAFAIGFILAACIAVYQKRIPGGFVRGLIRMGATKPENAVTLLESGYFRSVGIRWDLKHGGTIAKLVCRPDDSERTVAGTRVIADREETSDSESGERQPSLVERLNATEKRPAQASLSAVPEKGDSVKGEKPAEGGEDNSEKPEQEQPVREVNFETDRFYVPEDLKIRAELRYDRGGNSGALYLVSVAITIVVTFLICRFLTSILWLADKIIAGI